MPLNFRLFIASILVMILPGNQAFCSNPELYESDFLPATFYQNRRAVLRDLMPDSSMAIVFTSPERNRSNDVNYPYHPAPDFYYLTGFREPGSVLIIYKDMQPIAGRMLHEILIVQSSDPVAERWTGKSAGAKKASDISGISNCFYSNSFDTLNLGLQNIGTILYQSLPSGLVNDRKHPSDLFDLVEQFKVKVSYPPANGDDYKLGKMLKGMREIKQPDEIRLLRKAVEITGEGFVEMIKATRPELYEYSIEAIGEYIFHARGAEHVGYPSICGAGPNSCILHYEKNRKKLKSGELLLLDMGAEYHGYTADVTRTLPVSGSFNTEQKLLYDIVLKARNAAFSKCQPGAMFNDPHEAAKAVIQQGLVDLGIASSAKEADRYFPHHTSHHLGLDVHDKGGFGKLNEGVVMTIEPGIYIPEGSPCDPKWWNIGIRIEDDILIKDSGFENLSAGIPVETADIEKLMQESSVFNK